ncbi:MAG TPA: hypothetical protein VE956_00395 [Nodularia sp. (in: cyanobacteria)]|nr:hypothetical protein [Nodularia sp. (in: cyanobacteria)]HYW17767.1 hypothetical protein [Nodularia sp. (in: cyanobacteria)]
MMSFINTSFLLNQTFEQGEEYIKKTGGFKLLQIREGEKIINYDEKTVYVIVEKGIIIKIAREPKSFS